MATKMIVLAIVAISIAAMLQASDAKTIVVGDGLAWEVPPGGDSAYVSWAAKQTFHVGDILLFEFKTGKADVAFVTMQDFLTCNTKHPLVLKTDGPAEFTLDRVGEYYFIGTIKKHCLSGQKLAFNVTAEVPTSSPAPKGPVEYTVGDSLGWLVAPAGAAAYRDWAKGKTFFVGDSLVFNFVNGQEDVVLLTEENFKFCKTKERIFIESTSPVKFLLNTAGAYHFTSTFEQHCAMGQKLAIHAIPTPSSSPSGSAEVPSPVNTSIAPPPAPVPVPAPAPVPAPVPVPHGSAPPKIAAAAGFFITLLAMASVLQ